MQESLDDDSYVQSLVSDMTFFIDIHPTFDGKFVDAIIQQYEETGNITKNQLAALQSIHDRWKVSPYLQMKKYRQLIDTEMF